MATEETLVISQNLLQKIREHCLDQKPNEACGILTGRGGRVLHAYATASARPSPVYYEVLPEHQERILREMDARGEELVAIYHSHPTAAAIPSATDIRLAVYYPEALRVIVSLVRGSEMRAYRIKDQKSIPVDIVALREAEGVWHNLCDENL
ncbi:MAG TPA: M67 family metallopeptidase [Symbiobacteriaceae bacterium]|nr:M67 family metallopeptidase [Symbiobacteriaceae bacterium]